MADKKITDLQQVSSITDSLNFPCDDTLQTYRATIGQVKTYFAPIYIPPSVQTFTSGSGTYKLGHAFVVSGANATVGATFTNNGNTYTVTRTVSSSNLIWLAGDAAPTDSGSLTKASGTGDSSIAFSAVRKSLYLKVKMVGGGGGGGAGGTATPANAATAGGNTTFGSSLLTASGGGGGIFSGAVGGAGGAATVSSPAITLNAIAGGVGQGGLYVANSGAQPNGGMGGGNALGGAGYGVSSGGNNGGSAQANTGGGGGGGSANGASTAQSGGGGGAGAYIEAIITSPSFTYSYAVGAGGTGAYGSLSNGGNGGAGAAGIIVVEEFYQ